MTDRTVEEQLDALTTQLLGPLRQEKRVHPEAMDGLCLLLVRWTPPGDTRTNWRGASGRLLEPGMHRRPARLHSLRNA